MWKQNPKQNQYRTVYSMLPPPFLKKNTAMYSFLILFEKLELAEWLLSINEALGSIPAPQNERADSAFS